MAVPGGRNAMVEEDEGEEGGFFEDDGEAWADLDSDVPPHLRPLADAAQRGDVDALRAALDNHIGSIDDPVEDGDNVLHLSCLYGHLPCVQLLLERAASLDSRDDEGAIPLHDACAGGFAEIVQYILNFAGNPSYIMGLLDAVDVEGDTPLHHAARGEHLDVVKLLLDVGACPTKQNVYGQTPAELADVDSEVRSFFGEKAAAAAADASS